MDQTKRLYLETSAEILAEYSTTLNKITHWDNSISLVSHNFMGRPETFIRIWFCTDSPSPLGLIEKIPVHLISDWITRKKIIFRNFGFSPRKKPQSSALSNFDNRER